MDPEATLNLAEARIMAEDWAGAVVAITDYYRWRLRGGFEPRDGDTRVQTLTDSLTDEMELAVARAAMSAGLPQS